MAVDDDGAAVDTALSGGLAFGARALQQGCGLPSVTLGAALVGASDAALGSRRCDLQRGYAALGSGRALGVVWWCGSQLQCGPRRLLPVCSLAFGLSAAAWSLRSVVRLLATMFS